MSTKKKKETCTCPSKSKQIMENKYIQCFNCDCWVRSCEISMHYCFSHEAGSKLKCYKKYGCNRQFWNQYKSNKHKCKSKNTI